MDYTRLKDAVERLVHGCREIVGAQEDIVTLYAQYRPALADTVVPAQPLRFPTPIEPEYVVASELAPAPVHIFPELRSADTGPQPTDDIPTIQGIQYCDPAGDPLPNQYGEVNYQ